MQQQRVAVGGPDDGALAVNMMKDKTDSLNGVILKDFARNKDLVRWTEEFCRIGEPVKVQFLYYEGQGAEAGEDFAAQLHRQLEKDFQECQDYLSEEGLDKQKLLSPPAVTALTSLLQRMMQLHDSCTMRSGDRGLPISWQSI